MLIPQSSPIYTYETKIAVAASPRLPGSVILQQPTPDPNDYTLKVAYRRYINSKQLKATPEKPLINLICIHGSGMNKGIWHYQIDKLFNKFPDSLNLVIAPDHINQGESGALNRDKLGYTNIWSDLAKDYIQIAKNEERDHFFQKNVINIPVGHSMGGCVSLIMGLWEEQLFDAIVPINPVCHLDDDRLNLMSQTYNLWRNNELIQSVFRAANIEESKKIIETFFRKKSFFKRIHPEVLENLINDEVSDIRQVGDLYHKNTDKYQEYFAYYGQKVTIEGLMPVMNQINVPTYLVFSENDFLAGIPNETNRKLLKRVLTAIDVPDTYHLLPADKPDLTVDILSNVLNQRIDIFVKQGDKRYPEPQYLKDLGTDYREKLILKAFESQTKGKL